MATKLAPLSILLLAAGLSACAGAVVTRPAYVAPSYEPDILSYVVKQGSLYTEIVGDPFGPGGEGATTAALGPVVTEALRQGQFSGRPVLFSTDPAATAVSPYRVVVLFSPARNASAPHICGNSDQPRNEPEAGEVSVMIAFCNSDYRVSSTAGFAYGATSPDSPSFARLIRQAAAEIFSPRSIDSRGDGEFETGG